MDVSYGFRVIQQDIILTKKEADNLAQRITYLAGKDIKDLMSYRSSDVQSALFYR